MFKKMYLLMILTLLSMNSFAGKGKVKLGNFVTSVKVPEGVRPTLALICNRRGTSGLERR